MKQNGHALIHFWLQAEAAVDTTKPTELPAETVRRSGS